MARRTRSTGLFVAMVVLVLVGLGTFAVSTFVRSPADRLAATSPPDPTLLTAPVKIGSLDNTKVLIGRIAWPRLRTVMPDLDPAKASVVTGKPASVGRALGAGSVLSEISDRPVLLLPGQIPMLRDLQGGDRGDDVARLQTALGEAGYTVSDAKGTFGPSTTAALTRLYEAHGYSPPRVGDEGKAVYAAKGELVFVPVLPATVVTLAYKLGDTVAGDAAIATLGIGQPLVTATVDAASVLTEGTTVEVSVEDRSRSWTGVVARVGPRRVPEGGSAVVDLQVRLKAAVPGGYVGSSVEIAEKSRAKSGLIVPISAVNSKTDGSLYVRIVKGGRESAVAIKVLETAVGSARVAPVSAGALQEGDEVAIGVTQ